MEPCKPLKSQGAYHKRSSIIFLLVTWIIKIVDPYIIIISPAPQTPTLTASAAASIVPTVTGVPGARPVSSAATFDT